MPLIRYRFMLSLISHVYSDRTADKCDRFVLPQVDCDEQKCRS